MLASVLSGRFPFFTAENDDQQLTQMIKVYGIELVQKVAAYLYNPILNFQRLKPSMALIHADPESVDAFAYYWRFRIDGNLSTYIDYIRNDLFHPKRLLNDFEWNDRLTKLVDKMTAFDQQQRLTAKKALKHPYFTESQSDKKKPSKVLLELKRLRSKK